MPFLLLAKKYAGVYIENGVAVVETHE